MFPFEESHFGKTRYKVANLTTRFSNVKENEAAFLNRQKSLLSVHVPVVTHFIRTMRKINAVLIQGQRSIQIDVLALVLFFKVEATTFFFYGLSIIFFSDTLFAGLEENREQHGQWFTTKTSGSWRGAGCVGYASTLGPCQDVSLTRLLER